MTVCGISITVSSTAMNSYQAKRIPLKDILAALGRTPAKEVRGELWYLSPFRGETEPSFKINQERNIWYDFGQGMGGNVIDFAMQNFNTGTIGAALASLEQLMGNPSTVFSRSAPAKASVHSTVPASLDLPEIREIKPLENR